MTAARAVGEGTDGAGPARRLLPWAEGEGKRENVGNRTANWGKKPDGPGGEGAMAGAEVFRGLSGCRGRVGRSSAPVTCGANSKWATTAGGAGHNAGALCHLMAVGDAERLNRGLRRGLICVDPKQRERGGADGCWRGPCRGGGRPSARPGPDRKPPAGNRKEGRAFPLAFENSARLLAARLMFSVPLAPAGRLGRLVLPRKNAVG